MCGVSGQHGPSVHVRVSGLGLKGSRRGLENAWCPTLETTVLEAQWTCNRAGPDANLLIFHKSYLRNKSFGQTNVHFFVDIICDVPTLNAISRMNLCANEPIGLEQCHFCDLKTFIQILYIFQKYNNGILN